MAVTEVHLIRAAIDQGLIDHETLVKMRREAQRRHTPLLDTIAVQLRLPVSAFYQALAEDRGYPFVDPAVLTPPLDLVRRLPQSRFRQGPILPVARENGTILLATSDPDDDALIESVRQILGSPVRIALAEPIALKSALESAFAAIRRGQPESEASAPKVMEDPVALLDQVLKEAFLRRASDVHMESQQHGLRIRFRVDGRLSIYHAGLSPEIGEGLLSRVKVLAGLDIAEQRSPQDGAFSYAPPGIDRNKIDIRVATAPAHWGERATLRLLGMDVSSLTLESLGMAPQALSEFKEVIKRPHGMILLTGPTGSGKTTTLYAALREINGPEVNVMTVEDPVEYVMEGISQIRVGVSGKITFASALRSLLRHDPDVLMLGEIRDQETADVAMKAALTGHLIFSTLHTNSAVAAITRLADIGCERYLIGATLTAVIAQRLVRRLCPRCRQARPATEKENALLGKEAAHIFDPVGCAACLGNGFRSQIGLYETLWIDGDLVHLISRGGDEEAIVAAARKKKALTTLLEDGCAKVLNGTTTIDEVLRVTTEV